MPYQENKPEATDPKNVSQGDIQGNFQAIKTLIDINHKTFDDATNQGKHSQVTLPESAADPETAINEIALYTKESVISGNSGLFLRNENFGAIVELTNAIKASPGYTILPSGIIMAWGTGTIASGSANSAVNTFHTAFPTAVLSLQLTPYNVQTGAAQDYVMNAYTVTAASFYVNRNGSYTGTTAYFYYLAIGY